MRAQERESDARLVGKRKKGCLGGGERVVVGYVVGGSTMSKI